MIAAVFTFTAVHYFAFGLFFCHCMGIQGWCLNAISVDKGYKEMFPEGTDNKASTGHKYSIGGFCILDIVNPNFIHSYRFQFFTRVIP